MLWTPMEYKPSGARDHSAFRYLFFLFSFALRSDGTVILEYLFIISLNFTYSKLCFQAFWKDNNLIER